jgi:hypothetical protein
VSENLKGSDLSEAFWKEFGRPFLQEHFPDVLEKVVVGLLGVGSEVIGRDDGYSRDHGWGPRFTVLFPTDGFSPELETRINAARPGVFAGFDIEKHHTDKIAVSSIDRFFVELTKYARPPATPSEWMAISENNFYYAQAGAVFFDPSGVFTARRKAFQEAYFTDDVWLWRMAARLVELWHYGDYNLGRMARRGDAVGALIGQGQAVQTAMYLTFLLNRRFAPYWKWLHTAFRELPYLAPDVETLLRKLERADNLTTRAKILAEICTLFRQALCEQKILPDAKWRNFMGAFEIVEQRIVDRQVKQVSIWGATKNF